MKIFLGTLMLVAFSAVLGNSSSKADYVYRSDRTYYYYPASQPPVHLLSRGVSAVGNTLGSAVENLI